MLIFNETNVIGFFQMLFLKTLYYKTTANNDIMKSNFNFYII